MSSVLIQGPSLTAAAIHRLQALARAEAHIVVSPSVVWLEGADTPIKPAAVEYARAERVDLTAVPRRMHVSEFRLLAMDMDSTLISIECIDEIADLVGVKPAVKAITEAAMRGEIDFAGALRRRLALLEGLELSALERVYTERLTLSPGAEELLTFARGVGWKTLLVSGGFTYFTDRLKARLGLDYTLANTLEVKNGRLTGQLCGDIVDADGKAGEVRRVCGLLGCATTAAIVAGDGANDLKMMTLSGWSVAFRAKPVVQEKASMAINFCGLDALVQVFR